MTTQILITLYLLYSSFTLGVSHETHLKYKPDFRVQDRIILYIFLFFFGGAIEIIGEIIKLKDSRLGFWIQLNLTGKYENLSEEEINLLRDSLQDDIHTKSSRKRIERILRKNERN